MPTALIRHRLALLVAALIGLLHGSHWWFITHDPTVRDLVLAPVTLTADYDEAATYAARAVSFYYGDRMAGDINVAEYADGPSPLPVLNPMIMGTLGLIAGSPERGFAIANVILPALACFLIYLFLFELTRSRRVSLLSAVTFIFLPTLAVTLPPRSLAALGELLRPFSFGSIEMLYFNRIEYPQVTFPFFAASLYLLARMVLRGEWWTPIAAGVSVGVLFYTYFYDWAYLFSALSLLVLLAASFGHMRTVGRALIVLGIALFASLGYWINYSSLEQLPHYADIVSRIGVEHSKRIRFETWPTYLRAILLSLGLALFARLKRPPQHATLTALFLSALLLAIVPVLNAQVFIGFNPQPDHWHRVQFLPLFASMVVLLQWGWQHIRRRFAFLARYDRTMSERAPYTLIVVMFAAILVGQYHYAQAHADEYVLDESYAAAYAWINNNIPRRAVVGSIAHNTNVELPLYTHARIFTPNGINTIASNDEIWERYLYLNAVYGVPIATIKEDLFYLFHNAYRTDTSHGSYFRQAERAIPPDEQESYLARYATLIETTPPPPSYRLDFLIVGPRERLIGKDPALRIHDLTPIFDQDSVRIYQLNDFRA